MTSNNPGWIVPDWPAPNGVHSLITTRQGGVSQGGYASLNLGNHVGDDPKAVEENRSRVEAFMRARPVWLNQVHGTQVLEAARYSDATIPPDADASFTRQPGVACAVMTADCLPVLFCDDAGTVVAAAHAGWRGLLAGVVEKTVEAMGVSGNHLMACLGPAIGPQAFEVGDEVREAFVQVSIEADRAFKPMAEGKWMADIYALARQRLAAQGVTRVFGGTFCTFGEKEKFFSFRRDGRQTGRMVTAIWRANR